jgi:hypothetical protein
MVLMLMLCGGDGGMGLRKLMEEELLPLTHHK